MARPWHRLRRAATIGTLTIAALLGTTQARAGAATLPPPPGANAAPLLPAGTDAAVMARLFPKADPYSTNFAAWAQDRAGVYLTSYQREIAQSVIDHRLTAVPSCHGAGKSYLAALLLAWWLDTHPLDQTFVVWTAPRGAQVKAVVGRYLHEILTRLGNGITVNGNMEVKAPDGRLVGFGRKPADHDDQGFSGIHADYVFIVVDEATGVRESIWRSVRSFMTVDTARLLAIGNPDDPASYFRTTVHDPRLGYNVVRIDALRLPTMTREAVAPYPRLAAVMEAAGVAYATESLPPSVAERITKPKLVSEWLDEWGTENPYWKSKVRGEFPDISDRALFTPAMIEAAKDLKITPGPHDDGHFAFDIAEEGGDETVGYRYQVGKVRLVYSARVTDPMDTVGAIRKILAPFHDTVQAWIDANGVGIGVFSRLNELGVPVVPHKGSTKPNRPDVYPNRRSEVYYALADKMREGLIDLDPDDTILAGQLLDIRWRYHSSLPRAIETRQERAKRGGKSPDRADAVAILVAAPGGRVQPGGEFIRPETYDSIMGDVLDQQF